MMADGSPLAALERRLPPSAVDSSELLEAFLDYIAERELQLYPAQEAAILEIFEGNHVVLNTPTGSGKSLVALAACFRALADGQFAFYTAPIKALVTEKFFELCAVLGPSKVGMMTGDATVNRDAPIICCTAEILSNLALREGERAQADWVIMDEFHYYSDPERGVAWQLPLLTLPQARFVLMSATIGNPEFFCQDLERRTGKRAALVQSSDRPVPLDWRYSEVPLQETLLSLCEAGNTPVYVVHPSQRAASEEAQNLMSLNFLSKAEKQAVREELKGFSFDSPFGRELSRFVPHGIGVHHAGMLPKYRRLVERLAQKGLLRVISGTDTLGVGVNIPIRTVLFTQLCRFDGTNTRIMSVRDFHQVAGRAGRKGFDIRGSVIAQAPEHEIENRILKDKASDNPKKLRKLKLRKAPDRGFVPYNAETFKQLQVAPPEPLQSRLRLDHGLMLSALSHPGGCRRAKAIIRSSHEPVTNQKRLVRQGMSLFRDLVESNIVILSHSGVELNTDLQEDFSLHQALSLYAVEAISILDETREDYALCVLSVIESVVETPHQILQRQLASLKTKLMAEMKAQGVEYEERMKALEQVEPVKPEADFIYATFNEFAKYHPWVTGQNIKPKSIARDMYELCASFREYVKEYGLARSEGVLLRYLTDVYRTLERSVPDQRKTEALRDLEAWLAAELRAVDGSLLSEWEQLTRPLDAVASRADEHTGAAVDILRDERAFRVMLRNAVWRVVQLLARQDYMQTASALADLGAPESDVSNHIWTPNVLEQRLKPYYERYSVILTHATARGPERFIADPWHQPSPVVRQVLTDPEDDLEWSASFRLHVEATRQAGRPVLQLLSLGEGDE